MIICWLLIGRVCCTQVLHRYWIPPHRFYHTVMIIHHDFSQIHYEVVHFLIHSKLWKRHYSKFFSKIFSKKIFLNKLWNQPEINIWYKNIFQVTENGDYEKLLASVKFPIWDYDYDGLISNLKLILKDSGVKDKWRIPDSNLDSFLLSIRSKYQGKWPQTTSTSHDQKSVSDMNFLFVSELI